MDETYPTVSYKGNHSKNKEFIMPRETHKRGSQISKRGLSNELLCIPCAVDENGNVIGRSIKCGAVSYAGLNYLYSKDTITDRLSQTAVRHTYCLQAIVNLNLFK